MEQVSKKRNGLIIVAMVTALLQCGTASAQEMKPFLTLKTAKAMAEAADKKATAMGIKVHIAIVDDGGNLKYLSAPGRRAAGRREDLADEGLHCGCHGKIDR